jgi:TRAP-type C4-dicarboxylate transport system permease small subunit
MKEIILITLLLAYGAWSYFMIKKLNDPLDNESLPILWIFITLFLGGLLLGNSLPII